MYIRRLKIPSQIYAKHQYRQESEYKSIWCIIHSNYEYNYKVITGYDTISQEYYIIDRRKYENTKRYTNMNSKKDAHEIQKENSRAEQGAWKERTLDGLSMIHASAAHLSSTTGRIHKSFKIWTCRSRGVRNS